MGRPINKRWFGPTGLGIGTGLTTGNKLPIIANIGAGQFDGYILKQRATRKFKVSSSDNLQHGNIVLVDKIAGLLSGEGSLVGLDGLTQVAIKKLTRHIATDFSGHRYSWTLQDDSTQTLIILTSL
jgi:hypothetical protein